MVVVTFISMLTFLNTGQITQTVLYPCYVIVVSSQVAYVSL